MKDLIDERNKREKMQNSIIKWWNVNITIDGLYGSGTKASVMNFQKIWNIAQTGSTTKKFWYKILGK